MTDPLRAALAVGHTPLPWWVRTQTRLEEIRDCFVAAKDVQGLAYDAEILGDDEYRDGIERKLADAALIVAAVNAAPALLAEVEALRAERDEAVNLRESCREVQNSTRLHNNRLIAERDALRAEVAAMQWFASHTNLELDWGSDDEEADCQWRVHRRSGSRNDREWELLGVGATPLAAIDAARSAK